MKIEFVESIKKINEEVWNDLIKSSYPFLQYSFLLVLENSKCVGENTGWYPFYLLVKEEKKIIGLMPMYLKTDSHGEFIFDWSWADAFYRNGLEYYPKLVSAIPFTPAQGPRLCLLNSEQRTEISKAIKEAIEVLSSESGISGMHILLPNKKELVPFKESGFSIRTSYSFHWFNNNYKDFEDFLLDLTSRQRKNIKKERQKVLDQNISIEKIQGGCITDEIWAQFYKFYQLTYLKRGMRPYLNLDFFIEISTLIPDSLLLVMAKDSSNRFVAGALNFFDSDNLYGRYWGCLQEYDSLHFETCYYQGIEFCIEKELKKFDPGVQGEHKVKRGFWPIETYSAHWIKDTRFRKAIEDFLKQEAKQIKRYNRQCRSLLPFKSSVNIKTI